MGRSIPLAERFWFHVNKTDSCWMWTGAKDRQGYGTIIIHGRRSKRIRAHRLSWIMAHGDIDPSVIVCHHCDTPSCVNPNHLFVGSKGDNNKDKVSKGRHAFGERHGMASLTKEQVEEIRSRCITYKPSGAARFKGVRPNSSRALAIEFGVSHVQIRRIVRGKGWIT